ncbi:Zinc finger U1-type protein [Lasiodiplodia theobromae]|uniref:Cytoplasmic 60S subunit biogenesis factor REI1-like protein n=1 Tax=Lasiodiplodia theobromae TaxID=45133 RepID=A0A5N5CXR3_9PEZI|nr:Cytoplasmic 60S subunit biogenesis factor REI1-like protein [Lasiodiplodia theobromae]KAF9636405.1 Zinc finger U1-type protein [Lasiodiplodia theobromae]
MATPASHPFTCNTCQVAFRASELQRAHMQTDWHRYNLKRRVASLPPLSSEIFAEKVLANKASAAATAARAQFEKSCDACAKTYFSENAFNNHLNSQKHKQNVLAKQKAARSGVKEDDATSVMSSTFSLGEPIETASTGTPDKEAEAEFSRVVDGMEKTTLEDGDPISRRPTRPHHSAANSEQGDMLSRTTTATQSAKSEVPDQILDCLFCNYRSPSRDLNIAHMQRFHSLFIPEPEYLVDLDGLLKHLWRKIHEYYQCLYCNKLVYTAAGIQTHMRDTGHCKIAYDSEDEMLELGEFYDFTRTYTDDEGSETEGEDGADDGWETDSSVSDVPTDEITSVPIDDHSERYAKLGLSKHHSHTDPRPHKAADGFHARTHSGPRAVYRDEYELHLPTGRTAGHRSLRTYYRQNLHNYPSAAERAEQLAIEEAQALRRAGSDDEDDGGVELDPSQRGGDERGRGRQLVSRANGGMGMVGVSDVKKREVRAVEKREAKRAQRDQAKAEWTKNRKNNFQKHFRDPLLQ